jgi:TonB-dependent starch-binding outer membrane protein SusC
MKKKPDGDGSVSFRTFQKLLLIMKLTFLIALLTAMQVYGSVYSQNTRLSLSVEDKSMREVFKLIEQESNFRFFYNDEFNELNRMVNLDVTDSKIDDILTAMLDKSEVTYRILDNNVIVITPLADPLLQATTVKGKVIDKTTNEPIAGANIVIEGTVNGTISGPDGSFNINIPNGSAVLVVSFIGMTTQRVQVTGQQTITVTLASDVAKLEEVVVTGYGTQKKKDVTGAIAVISAGELDERPAMQFGNALEGKAAGIQVIRPSGQPQAGFSIKIRGTSSITSGSEPLYIVDGVQTYNVNEINPNDIESFTVLKDASSAAIYGSSGANGVVLITTKRGRNQQTRVNFSTSMMSSQAWKKLKVLNSNQFKDLAMELGLPSIDWNYYNANTNWQDLGFRKALTQNYQLSLQGGNEKTDFYLSGSVVNQDGIVINNSVKRATFKVNLDHKVNDIFKVGTSIAYDRWTDVAVPENDRNGILTRMLDYVPIVGVWDKNFPNQYAVNPFIPDLENPVSTAYQPEQLYDHNRFHGNAFGEISILRNLRFKSLLGFEHSNGIYTSFQNPTQTSYGRSMDGLASESHDDYNYWVSENTLTFNQKFGDHDFSLLGGFIASREGARGLSIGSHGFGGSTAITTVTAGTVQNVPQVTIYEKSHAAFIGRLNYSYKDKYLLTSNFRADGSGQFSSENRWGYFPSFSAGWRISKESFFENVSVINDLKLRAGWGIVGNDRANPYAWYGLVNPAAYITGGQIINAYVPSTLENSALKWEKTAQYNIGLDVAFLQGRIALNADYYKKKTSDLLLYVPVPASVGISGNVALQNAGSLENSGFEFQISSRNIVEGAFTWNTDFNINFNKNKVLDIVGTTIHSGDVNPAGTTYNLSIVEERKPLGQFYGFIATGVDKQTGMMVYKDLNKDEEITDADKTVIGNANPKFTYGLTNSFAYKNFTLDIFLQGVQGNDIFDATKMLTESMRLGMNQSATVLNRWKKPGDVTNIPRAVKDDVSNSQPSTRFIENGSYMRVKSLTLAYTLPKSLLERIKINRLQIYATAENLLTFTKYSGFDPEVSAFSSSGQGNTNQNTAQGVDYGTYPQSRDFIIGLNVTF